MLVTVKVVEAAAVSPAASVMVRTPAVRTAVGAVDPTQLAVQTTTGLVPCVKPVRVTTTLATLATVAGVKAMETVLVTPATADDKVIAGFGVSVVAVIATRVPVAVASMIAPAVANL